MTKCTIEILRSDIDNNLKTLTELKDSLEELKTKNNFTDDTELFLFKKDLKKIIKALKNNTNIFIDALDVNKSFEDTINKRYEANEEFIRIFDRLHPKSPSAINNKKYDNKMRMKEKNKKYKQYPKNSEISVNNNQLNTNSVKSINDETLIFK